MDSPTVRTTAWTVNLLGLAAFAWIVWYFWLSRTKGVTAQESDGVQQIAVAVKGGHDPDTIVVERGRPVRLAVTQDGHASRSHRRHGISPLARVGPPAPPETTLERTRT